MYTPLLKPISGLPQFLLKFWCFVSFLCLVTFFLFKKNGNLSVIKDYIYK